MARRYARAVRNELAVLTPEKVVVAYRLGNIGSRGMAQLADLLIIGALQFGLAQILSPLFSVIDPAISAVFFSLVSAFGIFAYFSLFEGFWNGQTLGKKMLRLRVRMVDGTPVTLGAALYRNLMRPADFLPLFYLAGLATIFLNERSQRLGDLAAGTLVIHEPAPIAIFSPAPYRLGVHPFEDAVGDLRGMTMEEYHAVKRLCDRFPELSPAMQAHWLAQLWIPFAQRHAIPTLPNVHPVYLMEAVVMRFGRQRGLI